MAQQASLGTRIAGVEGIYVSSNEIDDESTSLQGFDSLVGSPDQPKITRRSSQDSNGGPKMLSMQPLKAHYRWPLQIDKSRLEQSEMLSEFLEMHYPTPEAKADLVYRRSFLIGLPKIDLSSTPMLRDAIEAICFAHAGTSHKDGRLIVRQLHWSNACSNHVLVK